jgi:hypothetical protein
MAINLIKERILFMVMNKSNKNKILISVYAFLCALLIVNYFCPFYKIYYYFINGQIIMLEHYKINLPFPQWIFNGNNKYLFVISSDKDSIAEIAIDYRNVEMDYLLKACDQIRQEYKIYKNISGTEYMCDQIDVGLTLYFLSDDKFLFIRAQDYQVSKRNAALYTALFDSIEKNNRE